VHRYNLSPPVDVQALLEELADVSFEPWPHDCDAIAVGLSGQERPKVFVKSTLPRFRRRFTLAHELGHVRLAWHVGRLSCKPSAQDLTIEPVSAMSAITRATLNRFTMEMEGEATRFASHLLIPQRFIEECAAAGSVEDFLMNLDTAQVSAFATILRVSRRMLPGFVFVVEQQQPTALASPGTSSPVRHSETDPATAAVLQRVSHRAGTVRLSARTVHWYQLADFDDDMPEVEDARPTSDLLRQAIGRYAGLDKASAEQLFLRINGIAGGVLSKVRFTDAAQALAILRQRFAAETEIQEVIDSDDFDRYLRRKAAERLAGPVRRNRRRQ
jgi:Zn-dependent peptidase ImmA (M78 family)